MCSTDQNAGTSEKEWGYEYVVVDVRMYKDEA